jgi:molecular chaperone DnaJ
MSKDYYEILGVDRTADASEIKKAFRKKALKLHPDQNRDDPEAESKFKELNQAYDVLKDDQKRAAYERFGESAFDGTGPGPGAAAGGAGFGGAFSDIFEDMFGDMMGGGRAGGGKGPRRGSDVQFSLEMTLEDAYKGKSSTIKIPTQQACSECKGSGATPGTSAEKCSDCEGSGRIRAQQGFFTIERTCPKCSGVGTLITSPCSKCSGSGRTRKEKTLKFKIPAGVESGRRIRLSGEGEAGLQGGPNGDLYIMVSIKPHKLFRRDGANLFCRVPISMTTAALGDSVEVPTIEGKRASIKIPPGTQSGQQFRLKGKGMPVQITGAHGDMFIEVAVETPVNLSKKQKDLLSQLNKSMKGKAAEKHSPEASGFFSKVKELWDDLTE